MRKAYCAAVLLAALLSCAPSPALSLPGDPTAPTAATKESLPVPAKAEQLIAKLCDADDLAADLKMRITMRKLLRRLQAQNRENEFDDIIAAIDGFRTAKCQPPLEDRRNQLCIELLEQCAAPTSINQGKHNTCAVAALESRLYARHPMIPISAVTSLATTGSYTTTDGTEVSLPLDQIKPDVESARFPHAYADRSFASQLFQLAAVNAYWSKQNKDPRGIRVKRGTIQYIQKAPSENIPDDTGERLVINWENGIKETVCSDNGRISKHPSFGMAQLADLSRIMTGKAENDFLIGHAETWSKQPITRVRSEKALHATLMALKESGKLPAIIAVSTNSSILDRTGLIPFDGWHTVAVTGYDEQSGKVEVDNWWGNGSDLLGSRAVTLKALYQATLNDQEPQRTIAGEHLPKI